MATFESTYGAFLDDLKGTFPEFSAALTHASSLPEHESRFVEIWREHTSAVAAQDASIFAGAGIELVPGFVMTAALWGECGPSTHAAIWKYISTLLLLAASHEESLWDISGFQQSMEEMIGRLKTGAEDTGNFAAMFEQLSKMAESFGFKDMSGAAGKFKLPEKLFKGHIARIVEDLVKEFDPADFGISPEMLESKDPKKIFEYLQEIFTKKPDMLMSMGQKIAKKLQAKFASGAIRREEIIHEVEELMKEFSDNEAFSELFGNLGEVLKGADRSTGNEGSARRREVQERLRRKAAERTARRTAEASNIVVHSEAEARAAAMAALLMEEEAAATAAAASKKSAGVAKKSRK